MPETDAPPDFHVLGFMAAYAAVGIGVALAYVVVTRVGKRNGTAGRISARPRIDGDVSSRPYAALTFFTKVMVMWPWVLYTLLRGR